MPFAAPERPQELHHSTLSLPAVSGRFVEDFTMPQCLGFHLEADRSGRNLSFRHGFNVLSIEAMPFDVTHLGVQRNINGYNTFFKKCASAHFLKETAVARD
jgi:hypothetical protein